MKNILILITVGLFSIITNGQTCTAMFPMERGVKYQHSSYKGNGTLESVVDAMVTNVNAGDGRLTAMVTIEGQIINDGTIYNTALEVWCNGDITYLDPSQLIPPAAMNTFINEYNGTVEKSPMELPYDLHVGDELSNYYLEVYATVAENEVRLSFQTYGRTVTGREQMETQAGTFDCYLIESTTHSRIEAMGIGESTTTTSKHWVAKSIGTVKLENYKDGRLDYYTLLTEFRRDQ